MTMTMTMTMTSTSTGTRTSLVLLLPRLKELRVAERHEEARVGWRLGNFTSQDFEIFCVSCGSRLHKFAETYIFPV